MARVDLETAEVADFGTGATMSMVAEQNLGV